MSDRAATRTLLRRVLQPAGLRFRRGVVRIRTVESHALGPAALIELGADDIPALAEMQDAMVRLGCPALRRDPDAVALGHPANQSIGVRLRTRAAISPRPPNPTARTMPSISSGALNPYLIELKSTTPPPTHRPSPTPHIHGRVMNRKRAAGPFATGNVKNSVKRRTG